MFNMLSYFIRKFVRDIHSPAVANAFCDVFVANINGQWGSWTKWGECFRPCGRGVQRRRRVCDSPSPVNSGLDCVGPDRDSRVCECDPNFNASGKTTTNRVY